MFKNKKGFSLVELVVVIAILAIIAAMVVPALVRYTEDSRAQRDMSAMDEIVNAFQLALSDEKCYDEAIKYSIDNNFITYTDSSGKYGAQINDEEYWASDGSGKATTVTFNPETQSNGETIYRLANGIVNDMTYNNGSIATSRPIDGAESDDMQCAFNETKYLYNAVRAVVGDTLKPSSNTYKNSSFTVFIRFSQKDGVNVADVSGMFNGTNLHIGCEAAKGSGTNSYDETSGEPIQTETSPGKTEANYTQSGLGGGGNSTSTGDIDEYKHETYIENLQKENKCEYYSSIYLAAQDVNNGTPGENGDSTKNNAVACVYVDEEGVPCVLILKNCNEARESLFTKRVNINLGGKHITYSGTAIGGIKCKAYAIIDGRLNGSSVTNTSSDPTKTNVTACVDLQAGGEIHKGTYHAESALAYTIIAQGALDYYIEGCKITSVSDTTDQFLKVSIGVIIITEEDPNVTCIIDNCDIVSIGTNRTTAPRAINIFGHAIIKNTSCEAYGDLWVENSQNCGPTAMMCYSTSAVIENCVAKSNGIGIHAYVNTPVVIRDTKVYAYQRGVQIDAPSKLTNLDVQRVAWMDDYEDYEENGLLPYGIVNVAKAVIHDVSVAGWRTAITNYNATLWISSSSIGSGERLTNSGTSTLYLGTQNSFNESNISNTGTLIKTDEIYEQLNP